MIVIHFGYMTREELNELSIFALREFARRTGVYAPTSKKKGQLIDEIIEISEGKKQPYIAKTKQGRPPKNYGYPFAEVFVGAPVQNYTNNCFKQETNFAYTDDLKTLNGYVETNADSNLLWSMQNNRLVCLRFAKGLVEQYNLKTGDLLMVGLEKDSHDVVEDIISINNIPINNYSKVRACYTDIEHTMPTNFLGFDCQACNDLNIRVGESVYIYGASNAENSQAIVEMLNSCNADRKLYVNTSIVEKNKYLLNCLKNTENFVTNFSDPIDDARRAVILATERAKRIVEKGESCVLAVDDVQSVRGIDFEDLKITKNLMSVTKNGANGGSVTLLAIMPSNRSMDMFEKLADKRVKVLDRKLFLID